MNKLLLLAAGLVALASPALSQTSGSDDRDSRGSYDRREGARGGWREDRGWRDMARDSARDSGREMGDEGRRGGGDRRGARFMVRSGDSRVAVACDSGESMRACVDATLTLLDRVRSQSSATGSGTSSGTTSGSTSGPAPTTR
jgi:hypothetical protein